MLQQYHRVQGELRVITNRPEKPTNSYMKFLVIAMMVAMGGAGVFIAYDSGAFDGVVAFSDNLSTIGDGFSGYLHLLLGFKDNPQVGLITLMLL
jgi:hypothetical protein